MIDISQKLKIEALQNHIYEQFGQDTLHILNGQAMYEQFHTYQLMGSGDYVPFNEAMCSHDTDETIFSAQFIKMRASGHQVTVQEYESVVMTPLKSLLEKHYKCIVLWFGYDMFCQMNVLTVLAYLDQAGYRGKVFFHTVNEMSYEVEATEVLPEGFKEMYQQVLIHHRLPEAQLMAVMSQGIRLYLEYIKQDNEITAFINKHLDKSQDELLKHLFKRFPQYGLGDTQYIKIIQSTKEA
ncbi:AraC family transcriptional regulator [Paenibacillus marinisediminis]